MIEGYGLTESGPIITLNPRGRNKLGTIGPALPGFECKVIDSDGNILPQGEAGELVVRSECNALGYYNRPEAQAERFRDGWVYTGDIVACDPDGWYTFRGRVDDQMQVGGENVFPAEVENILATHPEVRDVCVVPVPHEVKGQVPVAFVVRNDGSNLGEKELIDYYIERGPAYSHPRHIYFIDEMPLLGTGKTDLAGSCKAGSRARPRNGALSPRRLTCHSECLSDLEPGTGLESPITTLQGAPIAMAELSNRPPLQRIRVCGFGHAVPPQAQTNDAVERDLELPAGWIAKRTGIDQRRVVMSDQATSDLAIASAQHSLRQADQAPGEIRALVLATSTPDHLLPPTAPRVAAELGCGAIPAFDMAVACSGFVYGLVVAEGLARSLNGPVLLIAANVLSKRVNRRDPATVALFADAAGSVILTPFPAAAKEATKTPTEPEETSLPPGISPDWPVS